VSIGQMIRTSDLIAVSQDHHETDLENVPQEGDATDIT
jgi:hypothetical protein